MRLIWNPLGMFLNVLLCNCEGYVAATDDNFAEYTQWVREHQVDTSIFYATTPLTVGDELYLSNSNGCSAAVEATSISPG